MTTRQQKILSYTGLKRLITGILGFYGLALINTPQKCLQFFKLISLIMDGDPRSLVLHIFEIVGTRQHSNKNVPLKRRRWAPLVGVELTEVLVFLTMAHDLKVGIPPKRGQSWLQTHQDLYQQIDIIILTDEQRLLRRIK